LAAHFLASKRTPFSCACSEACWLLPLARAWDDTAARGPSSPIPVRRVCECARAFAFRRSARTRSLARARTHARQLERAWGAALRARQRGLTWQGGNLFEAADMLNVGADARMPGTMSVKSSVSV